MRCRKDKGNPATNASQLEEGRWSMGEKRTPMTPQGTGRCAVLCCLQAPPHLQVFLAVEASLLVPLAQQPRTHSSRHQLVSSLGRTAGSSLGRLGGSSSSGWVRHRLAAHSTGALGQAGVVVGLLVGLWIA